MKFMERKSNIWSKNLNNPFMIPFNEGVNRFAGEDPVNQKNGLTAFKSPFLGVRAFCVILEHCIKKNNDPKKYVLSWLPDSEYKINLSTRQIDNDFLYTIFQQFLSCLGSEYTVQDLQYIQSLAYTHLYQQNLLNLCTVK